MIRYDDDMSMNGLMTIEGNIANIANIGNIDTKRANRQTDDTINDYI